MSVIRKEIDLGRLREIIEAEPGRKKTVQDALDIDRQKISRILNGVRRIEAGELLTIAEICGIDPRSLAES
jgi:plasmid maintenance system antidote protein VapI